MKLKLRMLIGMLAVFVGVCAFVPPSSAMYSLQNQRRTSVSLYLSGKPLQEQHKIFADELLRLLHEQSWDAVENWITEWLGYNQRGLINVQEVINFEDPDSRNTLWHILLAKYEPATIRRLLTHETSRNRSYNAVIGFFRQSFLACKDKRNNDNLTPIDVVRRNDKRFIQFKNCLPMDLRRTLGLL